MNLEGRNHRSGSRRSGRDSNPQVLSDARFRGVCNSRSATAPLKQQSPDDVEPCRPGLFGSTAVHPACAGPSIGAPGFEPGTSATRTQRSTGLSHAPDLPFFRTRPNGRSGMRVAARRGLANRPLGRIARHLSAASARTHSASRFAARVGSKPRNLTEFSRTDGVGCAPLRDAASRTRPLERIAPHPLCRIGPNPRCVLLRSPRGFEAQNLTAFSRTDGVGCAPLRDAASRTAASGASRDTSLPHRPEPTLRPASQSAWVRSPEPH